MSQFTNLDEQKRVLMDDLRASIRYVPNREADLLAFMRLYLKEDAEHRPAILDSLRCCMDGQPYPDPYAGQRPYSGMEVDRLDRLLTEFLDGLPACSGDSERTDRNVRVLVEAIDGLNESCGFALLDDWRRQKLFTLLDSAEALALGGAEPVMEMR